MTAATLQVPDGWRFAGTIAHDPTCRTNGSALKFTILSPDGGTTIVVLPGAHWNWSTSAGLLKTMEAQHCPGIDIDSAANFLVNIAVPGTQPGATIISVQGLAADKQAVLAEQQRQSQAQYDALAARTGMKPLQTTIDGARVRIRFSRGGHAFEEELVSVISCNTSEMPAMYRMPASSRRGCSARSISMTRAPEGRLDALLNDPQFTAIGKSIQLSPDWMARVQHDQQEAFQRAEAANNAQFQSFMKADRDRHATQMAQGAAFQQNLQHSTDQAMAADRARQDAIDASAHATALHSLDRQEFRNPNTGEIIEASDKYNHQWLSSDGKTLIQTENHTLNPNGVIDPVRESWTELEPKPLK